MSHFAKTREPFRGVRDGSGANGSGEPLFLSESANVVLTPVYAICTTKSCDRLSFRFSFMPFPNKSCSWLEEQLQFQLLDHSTLVKNHSWSQLSLWIVSQYHL
jgi:hypothetical protein